MKFYDLGLGDSGLRHALDAAYHRVMDRGWMVLGPEIEAFEQEFASFCDANHCVGVGNGLDALVLTLRAAGIGPDDEVIVPTHTFAATWLAVLAIGARPVPVEIDTVTFTLDPAAAGAAITSKTRAIIPVSLYGHPVDMDPIMMLADRHGIFVLEDAAQSHGATYRGRRTGGLAHATAFSFYPSKNLGALGDGGAITTNDPVIADRLRRLRNYGSIRKYVHDVVGVNSRLDELQAAFLRVRLARLEGGNVARRALANAYGQQLKSIDGLQVPTQASWAEPAYHLYVVRTPHREAVRAALEVAGIESLIHYPTPCHLQPAFEPMGYGRGAFPIAERMADEVLSLPLWPEMPTSNVAEVSDVIRKALP